MSQWSTTVLFLLSVAATAAALSGGGSGDTPPSGDIIWYVAPGGSMDIRTCGRTREEPCGSLQTILDLSPLFTNQTSGISCYRSSGNDDGRTSTTIYFLEGNNFVPPVCLVNWRNLRVVGLGDVTITTTEQLGNQRAFLEYYNCTNITIEGLDLHTSVIGKTIFLFQDSRDIAIRDCNFPVTAFASFGMEIERCSGSILIEHTEFYGAGGVPDEFNPVLGLDIEHGSSSQFISLTEEYEPFDAVIRNCTFHDFVSGGEPIDSYRRSRDDAIVLQVTFNPGANNNRLLVENSSFTYNQNTRSSGVLVDYESYTANNTAHFVNCTFTGNSVRYGGGVAAYFYSMPRDSALEIEDCNFRENCANFEGGGVFAAFLSRFTDNYVRIRSSVFYNNAADYGSAVFLFNNPAWVDLKGPSDSVAQPLVTSTITDCKFLFNVALLSEGAINTLRMELHINGSSLVTFQNSVGSAVIFRGSLGYFHGNVNFTDNVASAGAAIKLQDRSRVDMSDVTSAYFTRNYATFSGGAIYADDSSTTLSANEYNHTLAENRFGLCFVIYGNEFLFDQQTPRIFFDGNTASMEGQTISAYSLRGCVISNFVPFEISRFLSIRNDGTVVFTDRNALGATSTGPSYLFFYGASTRCYKSVGSITYLLPNCSNSLLNDTFYLNQDLKCGVLAFNRELGTYYGPGTALYPTVDKLITPWAGIETSWTATPGVVRQQCPEPIPGNLVLSPAPGEEFDLTIQLADQLLNYVSSTIFITIGSNLEAPPGVLMQLNGIQYSYIDRLYFTPNRALYGMALVGLPGTEGTLRVTATSQIKGQLIILTIPFKLAQCPLGYYDPPGAKTLDEVNFLLVTQFSMTQRIPADQPLACHCFDDVSRDVVTFSNRTLNLADPRCIAGYTVELNSLIWAGLIHTKEAHVDVTEHPSRITCPPIPVNATPVNDSLTNWIRKALQMQNNQTVVDLASNPVDVVPIEDGLIPGGGAPVKCYQTSNVSELVEFQPTVDAEFSIEICTRGFCRGDSRTRWFLSDVDYPCMEHRQGPLCGQCEPGYALTLYSTFCRDCGNALTVVPVMLTLFFGAVLVVGAVVLNFGVSPTMDSLLFFIQAILIILSGRTDYEGFQYLAVLNPDFTFNLCITPSLDGLGRLVAQYVTPLYILFLMCVVLLLTRIKGLSKFLGRHSFLQAIWFLVLITYLNIANTTFEILHCRTIGPQSGGIRETVLVHDPSVRCYQGAHLPFGILALLLAITVVAPFPIYVLILMRFPKFKPITDVYCSVYKDKWRFWVSWSLARRLLLVVVGVFISDFIIRHFVLLIITIFPILVVHVMSWPYHTRVDNHFGFFVSWALVVIACVTQPDLYLYIDPGRAVSSVFVTVVIVIGLLLLVLETILRFRGTTIGKYFNHKLQPKAVKWKSSFSVRLREVYLWRRGREDQHELEDSSTIIPRIQTLDATGYREPLLDSYFGGHAEDRVTPPPRAEQPKRVARSKQRSGATGTTARPRPTATVVAPERDSGDSGFATSTYADVV